MRKRPADRDAGRINPGEPMRRQMENLHINIMPQLALVTSNARAQLIF